MLARYFGAAALALQCAHAFRDASPFFLFSSNDLDTQPLQDARVASSSSIESKASSLLSDCSDHAYIFVTQHGVSTADFATRQSTPHLMKHLNGEDKKTKTAVSISNVVGNLGPKTMRDQFEKECSPAVKEQMLVLGKNDKIPHVKQDSQSITVTFAAPPMEKEARASALAKSDAYLNDLLEQLVSYTVIYTTTPVSPEHYQEIQHPDQVYEMDSPFPSGMHGDLKRDLGAQASSSNSSNLNSNLPLFEKYQFVSQGIFVGGVVTLLLFAILSVGVSAIANLEVSYMAFSKEMGPAAQKKN